MVTMTPPNSGRLPGNAGDLRKNPAAMVVTQAKAGDWKPGETPDSCFPRDDGKHGSTPCGRHKSQVLGLPGNRREHAYAQQQGERDRCFPIKI